MERVWRRRIVRSSRRGRCGAEGFVLLLALVGGLLLLLSGLSLQTLALQSRASEQLLSRRRQQQDWLASAAQLVAAQLQRHPCLIALPLQAWSQAPSACITPAELEQLASGRLPEPDQQAGSYAITAYTPPAPQASEPAAAQLDLLWQPPQEPQQGPQRRQRFQLLLADGALRGIRP
ncbi:MAG: hypothetical protein VKK94_01680 [Cyanobacteriota bacterium]|nr:hypothetical protein [Cyanobacteriota bacterium]